MIAAALAFSVLVIISDPKLMKRINGTRKRFVTGIESLLKKAKQSTPLYLEIYRNSSWKTMLELSIFKLRTYISIHLETGLLVRPRANFYDLIYYDGINRYVVRFPKIRGPSNISYILDPTQADVTTKIKEYLGPSHNFHGIFTSPMFLGYESLTFVLLDGRTLVFNGNDRIIF